MCYNPEILNLSHFMHETLTTIFRGTICWNFTTNFTTNFCLKIKIVSSKKICWNFTTIFYLNITQFRSAEKTNEIHRVQMYVYLWWVPNVTAAAIDVLIALPLTGWHLLPSLTGHHHRATSTWPHSDTPGSGVVPSLLWAVVSAPCSTRSQATVIQVGSPHCKCEFKGWSRRWSNVCLHSWRNAGGAKGRGEGIILAPREPRRERERESVCVCVVRWNGMEWLHMSHLNDAGR